MEVITNYWAVIVVAVAAIAVAVYTVYNFYKKPTSAQLASVKAFLLYAVTEAEKEFGANTGKLKLSYVYGLFIKAFPVVANLITFETFSSLVDEVLATFKNMLNSNAELQLYVGAAVETIPVEVDTTEVSATVENIEESDI